MMTVDGVEMLNAKLAREGFKQMSSHLDGYSHSLTVVAAFPGTGQIIMRECKVDTDADIDKTVARFVDAALEMLAA